MLVAESGHQKNKTCYQAQLRDLHGQNSNNQQTTKKNLFFHYRPKKSVKLKQTTIRGIRRGQPNNDRLHSKSYMGHGSMTQLAKRS